MTYHEKNTDGCEYQLSGSWPGGRRWWKVRVLSWRSRRRPTGGPEGSGVINFMHCAAPDTGGTQIGHCLHHRVRLVANLCSCSTAPARELLPCWSLERSTLRVLSLTTSSCWVGLTDSCATVEAAAKLPVLWELGEISLEPFALLLPFVCGALQRVLDQKYDYQRRRLPYGRKAACSSSD